MGGVVAFAVVLGLAIRLLDLGGVSFDLDEATSAYTVSALDHFATNVPAEIHPPLWYAFLFVWSRVVGSGDVALRLSSVLGGVLWIPAFALLARRLFDPRTANVAVILAAVWPLSVAQSQLLREYAWIPLLATIATLATATAMERDDRRSRIVWGLALALIGAVNYQGLALAAGLVVGAVWSGIPVRRAATACGVAALASIPTLLSALHFLGLYVPRGSAGIGPGSVIQVWSGLIVGSLPHVDPVVVLSAAAIALIAALYGATRLGRWSRTFASVFVFAGIVPAALAQTAVNYPLGPNYFTVLVPFTVLLVARAISSATRPAARVVSGVTVASAMAGLLLFFAVERAYLADFRGLAALVERSTTTESLIVVTPPYFAVPVERYYVGPLPVRSAAALPVGMGAPGPDAGTAWLIVNPPSAPAPSSGALEVPTGWWMRVYRIAVPSLESLAP